MNQKNVVLSVQDVHLSFGGVEALSGISFDLLEGEILSVIGPNGSGKTCLLNCINGFYRPQRGRILYDGKELNKIPPHRIAEMGIARTFQNLALYTGLSAVDNIMAGRHFHIKTNLFTDIFWFGPTRSTEVNHRRKVEDIIDFLEIEPIRYQMAGTLPYGARKRVELGRALAMEPRLLLLDEPMGGMNLEEKEDITRFILDVHELQGIPIILVEHDMGVVMDIADRIVVFEFGKKLAEGSPETIKRNPAVVKAYLGEE
jgi:branched-chain amino acid transport system ATP-binding protein